VLWASFIITLRPDGSLLVNGTNMSAVTDRQLERLQIAAKLTSIHAEDALRERGAHFFANHASVGLEGGGRHRHTPDDPGEGGGAPTQQRRLTIRKSSFCCLLTRNDAHSASRAFDLSVRGCASWLDGAPDVLCGMDDGVVGGCRGAVGMGVLGGVQEGVGGGVGCLLLHLGLDLTKGVTCHVL